MARLEGAYEQIDRRLGAIEGEIRSMRAELSGEIQNLGRKIDANFRWIVGIVLVNWITLMLAVLFRP